MSRLFGRKKSSPAPLPPMPTITEAETTEEKKRLQAKQKATILTGGRGLIDSPEQGMKTLLGA